MLIGAVVTCWAYRFVEEAAQRRSDAFFAERIAEAQDAIEVRVNHYLDALRGGASYYESAPHVDRESWRIYTDALDLRRRYPGINGLGVILDVPEGGLEAWRATVLASGYPKVDVGSFPGSKPGREPLPHYLITMLEGVPPGGSAPIGRNIATDPSRRAAAEQARDTGEAQINQRIPGSRDTQRHAGLILYVPLYRTGAPLTTVRERRAALRGWVYAQVFPDVFLDGVLGPLGEKLRLHFFEAGGLTPDKLLYATKEPGAGKALPRFEQVTQLTLAGETFQLGWRRGPRFPAVDLASARGVAASLALATLLLAGLVMSLQSIGRRATAIAVTRTSELAASEERFRLAFDFAGIGMALVAMDGRLLRVNQAFCDIVGYPEPRLLQLRFQDITHPDDLAADLALLDELVAGKRRSYQLEKRYVHRDGHGVWIRLTVSLVRDAQDRPLHSIAQVEDIGERKRLESTLASARDRAIEDSRLKTDFVANVIHQIRAPANELIGATLRLRNRLVAGEQVELVRALEHSSDAFMKVLNDVLDYWNLEFTRIALEHAPFGLRDCVNGVLNSFAAQAKERGVALESFVAQGVPVRVVGDARRLRQIIAGLLGSAIRSADGGEIRLTLTAEPMDASTGRQRLKFAVRDAGSPAATSAAVQAGNAIELAISKRLAELMDGTLWTESEPGRGTTFHFTVAVAPIPLVAAT